MTRRGLVVAAVLGSVLWALLAGPAGAVPNPQTLATRSEAWLSRTLEAPIPHRPIVVGRPGEMKACGGLEIEAPMGCLALAYSDRIALAPSVMRGLRSLGRREAWDTSSGQVLIHEQLHRPGAPAEALEEGIVDALAWDLVSAWSHALLPVVILPDDPTYEGAVQVVREASHRATGRPWPSRQARHWRRALWRASPEVGERMVQNALTRGEQ